MKRIEIEALVREWLDHTSVDARTGLPPDAKVSVEAHYISTFGHLKSGRSRPDSGMELWSVTAILYFPENCPSSDEPDDMGLAISQVLGRLAEAVAEDPTLGHRGWRAQWRGTDGDEPRKRPSAPADYPWAVAASLSIHITPAQFSFGAAGR